MAETRTQESPEHAARLLEEPVAKLQLCTALDLPDFPESWRYETGRRTNFGIDQCFLHVKLTARDSFLEQEDAAARSRKAAEAPRALVEAGRPPSFFTKIFAIKA